MIATAIRKYKTPSLDVPDRLFQITQASRTHTQLWLQSDRNKSKGELRLEVLFQSVQYLCIPFAIKGLALRQATTDECTRLSDLHGLKADSRWGIYLLSRQHDWFVVSAPPVWAEADLGFNDKSAFWSSADRPDVVRSIGTLE